MDLIFATHNPNKVLEVQKQLDQSFNILALSDLDYHTEIPEPYETLEENALEKAKTIYRAFKKICFSDDTGLFVPALNGAPGVYSARYAGPKASAAENMEKLCAAMELKQDRRAYFKTVIALQTLKGFHFFEGMVWGTIAREPIGTGGFGYDPIFIPQGYDQSFAMLPQKIKQEIGHRAKAIRALTSFLKTL